MSGFNINTVLGALIAAVNVGLTAVLALITAPGIKQLADIPTLSWLIVLVGVGIAFFKDLQSLWTRHQMSRMTNKPMAESKYYPPLAEANDDNA